jgi:hypothetical protein
MANNAGSKVNKWQTDNLVAAKIILQDVVRYGGETAGLVRWARLTVAHRTERRAA